MKNFLFLGLIGTTVFLNSCSSSNDDTPINSPNDTPSAQTLFLSKVTTTYLDLPGTPQGSILTFSYNNQAQLVKIQSQEGSTTFEYSNGKPIKSNTYNNQQQLKYYSEFNYNGDQLVSNKRVSTTADYNGTYEYSYYPQGKLSSSRICNSADCTSTTNELYSYYGDNVLIYTIHVKGNSSFSVRNDYSYDDKLNPYTNLNKYLKIIMGNSDVLSKNNCTIDKNSSNNNGTWQSNKTITYTYEYNGSGFPVKAIGKDNDGKPIIQYNYEYTSL